MLFFIFIESQIFAVAKIKWHKMPYIIGLRDLEERRMSLCLNKLRTQFHRYWLVCRVNKITRLTYLCFNPGYINMQK